MPNARRLLGVTQRDLRQTTCLEKQPTMIRTTDHVYSRDRRMFRVSYLRASVGLFCTSLHKKISFVWRRGLVAGNHRPGTLTNVRRLRQTTLLLHFVGPNVGKAWTNSRVPPAFSSLYRLFSPLNHSLLREVAATERHHPLL